MNEPDLMPTLAADRTMHHLMLEKAKIKTAAEAPCINTD